MFLTSESHMSKQMQSNMQLYQGSKQHFKLSKTSPNKKNKMHKDPKTHTHTHTLNKSNQFYIPKTSLHKCLHVMMI